MKRTLFALAFWSAVAILATLSSCTKGAEEDEFMAGNRQDTITVEKIIYRDHIVTVDSTIYVYVEVPGRTDTVHITTTDTVVKTIVVTKDLIFGCYELNKDHILVDEKSEGETVKFSFTPKINTSGDVYRSKELQGRWLLENSKSYFTLNNTASFTLSSENDMVTLNVSAPGAKTMVFNNDTIQTCHDNYIEAHLTDLGEVDINGKAYNKTRVTFSLRNENDLSLTTTDQFIYSPIKKAVNERKVTVTHTVTGDTLYIKGNIDNTLYPDTTVVVSLPLAVRITAEGVKRFVVKNFDISKGANPTEISKTFVAQQSSNGGLVVNFNNYTATYQSSVIISSKEERFTQSVAYINDFDVTFFGEHKTIALPLSVTMNAPSKGEVITSNNEVNMPVDVIYQAKLDSKTASATQEIQLVMSTISWENQMVLEAYRTITFNSHTNLMVFDCVLTQSKTDPNRHFFHYRQIVNKVPQSWETKELNSDEYEFIIAGKNKGGKYALTMHYHKNYGTMNVGYLTDKCPQEVVYWAHKKTPTTMQGTRFTFLGDLNTAIVGQWIKDGDLIRLVVKNDVIYNGDVVATGGDIYFY